MRELLILVPGLGRTSRSQQKEAFVQGLLHASEHVVLERVEGEAVRVGTARLASQDGTVEYDVTEAYWNDLVPSLTSQPLKTKVLRGLSLLFYWSFSGIWKGVWARKYLTMNMIMSSVVLLLWYFGTLALFAEAVSSSFKEGTAVAQALKAFGSWKTWAIATAAMGVMPVALMVDIVDFSKRYIAEEAGGVDGPALRLQIVKRVRDQVLADMGAGPYERVTVVSHSFGTVVAVDVLADLPVPTETHLRSITLGSPLELLAKKASWLNGEKQKCLERPQLVEWVDVNSPVDWLCTGADLPDHPKAKTCSIRPTGTLIDRLAGKLHCRYFDNQDVARCVLEPLVISSDQDEALPSLPHTTAADRG